MAAEHTSFDILGRVTASKQTTDGVTYGNGSTDSLMTYGYNLSGAMIEQQYPSGRKVQNTLDASGDLEMVTSRKNANSGYWAYANNFTYNAAGAVTSMQLGNGAWESTVFNSRLQPEHIYLGTTATGTQAYDKLKLDYSYGTTANNGNVLSQTITVATVGASTGFAAVQTYNYDSLNRLKDATESLTPTGGSATETWKQTFTFDRFGNRNFDEANTTTLPKNCGSSPSFTVCTSDQKKFNPSVQTANNRLVLDQDNDSTPDYAYDSSGNTTKDADSRTFVYDAENKQVEVKNSSNATIGQYFYDGDGKRVKKYVPATGETTIFVYDAIGKLVAEYSTIVAPTQDAKVAYLTNDHLGSPRINTDRDGAVTARHDYHPFGEEVATSQRVSGLGYTAYPVRKQFTGYERDNEINLDYAGARYYNNAHGRFTSTDPILIKKGRLVDPQRLNLYVYVRNSPYKFVDTTGEDLTLANAVAQQHARSYIDKNLKPAERANVTIQGNKVVLVNPTGIDPTKASEGYKLLYEFIKPNSKKNASFYGIQQGQTVTTPLLGTLTYQQVAASADIGSDPSKRDVDFVVAVGANVQAADSQEQPTEFPEHLIFAHSLAHISCGNVGMCAVDRENLLRTEQQRPLRSTTIGHTNIDANGNDISRPFNTASVETVGSRELVTTTPGVIQTTITARPQIPLPTPPKKPNE